MYSIRDCLDNNDDDVFINFKLTWQAVIRPAKKICRRTEEIS